MKTYDVIAIGTGSAMNVVEAMLQRNPELKIAVIDKDDPGGICLTRGCIPSKLLLYPADLLRTLKTARGLGIDVEVKQVDFPRIMERMRSIVQRDIREIHKALSGAKNIDYYQSVAEFTGPYQLKVEGKTIISKMILLCSGSRPHIPPIKGLDSVKYHTSDTVLGLQRCPSSLAILGGGYIAAEYGHFFSAMGADVTIIGRNPQFLPAEEPEVSLLAKNEMAKHMMILTNHEVITLRESSSGGISLMAKDRSSGEEKQIQADEVLVAVGRVSNSDILHPERGGITTDEKGWILVNEYMETSQPNIWALGDANGRYLFKHVANYESKLVFYNAVLGRHVKADYHAIPHAVFCYPEIASVGLRQKEAIEIHREEDILIGFHRFQDTAKGEAMGLEDCFVKVLVEKGTNRILGAHIIGPQASVLIQEIITLMYTQDRNMRAITGGMHIHPSLSEVVERTFFPLMAPGQYQDMIRANNLAF